MKTYDLLYPNSNTEQSRDNLHRLVQPGKVTPDLAAIAQ
jgi:hypothetical protein